MKQEYDSAFANKVIDKLSNIINSANFEHLYNVSNRGFGGYNQYWVSNKTDGKDIFSIECSYGHFRIFINDERLDIENTTAPAYIKLNVLFKKLNEITRKNEEKKKKQIIQQEQNERQKQQKRTLDYLENIWQKTK